MWGNNERQYADKFISSIGKAAEPRFLRLEAVAEKGLNPTGQ
jgi:hypothetical protein